MVAMVTESFLLRAFLCLIAVAQSGCYLMQAAEGQMSLLAKREALDKVIANPQTAEPTRQRLKLLQEAREFASRQLGLPNNGSYRSYVALDREYVVWNVFATAPYSIKPNQWCFPFAGCVVYRGYFKQAAAERYARRYRLQGNDASIAGAAAYSTLGHFDDPILSTMLRSSDLQLIGTLFHELAHQVMYVKGDSTFNESFAMAVEEEGIARWLVLHQEQQPDRERLQLAKQRGKQFTSLLLNARARLDSLYNSGKSTAEMAWQKPLEFGRLKFEYWQLREGWNGYAGYDHWFNRALNNADLVPVATYDGCLPGFRKLLDESNHDLSMFYGKVRELAQQIKQRMALCEVR
jgi:predicted aminopeptidase